jgi:hypothetical protein
MAQTRGATGNSKPRVFAAISTEPTRKRKTPLKTKTTTTKKTGAGITKKRAPNTHHKRKPSLKDKVEGAIEKIEGAIEHKPGKKAAGTKKMRGTDGKNSRTAKVV